MHRWEKLGRVLAPGDVDAEWMQEYAQAPAALVRDDHVRVYFSCRPPADARGQFTSRLAYVDLDRTNLFTKRRFSAKPVLELGARGTFDEFGTNPASVIQHDDDVWMYYAGWSRCESVPFNAAIGLAISRDRGETFARLGSGPVLSYSIDEPFVIGSPRIRRFNGVWYLWYVAGKRWIRSGGRPEPVYRIRMASSSDGISWHKEGRDLLDWQLDEDECQASPDVFELDGTYHMYFSYRYCVGFQARDRGYRIGSARSRDLLHWTREDGEAGLRTSAEGWDSETVSYPHVFRLDDTLYMLYQGNHVGRTGFGLARMATPSVASA